MANCPHRGGWTHHGGESRCNTCGVRRFTEYGAVRPDGLPRAVTPPAPDRRATDRAAALNISRAVVDSRGFGPVPWCRPVMAAPLGLTPQPHGAAPTFGPVGSTMATRLPHVGQ
ncbi:DUF6255 family natural product biosynthesis protein [Streptomyces albireticuli]|uniref:DUF6255 family natural product biosynthesis protein n=1 Tax=Streptomyces albireticuli TaxID=1940 RepID=UPI00369DF08B